MTADVTRRRLLLSTLAGVIPTRSTFARAEVRATAGGASTPFRPDPELGPKSTAVRDTRRKLLFYQVEYGFTGPIEGLSGARTKATPILYIPPSQNAVRHRGETVFDHSEAGIEAGSERACAFILDRATRYGVEVGLLDLENYASINVPTEVGYDATDHDDHVVRYLPLMPDAFRRQAIWFNRAMAIAMFRRLRREMPRFELGWYNIPRTIGWYEQAPNRVALQVNRTYEEAFPAVIAPFAAFTGPGSQMVVPASSLRDLEAGRIKEELFIDWKVNSCRVFKERMGPAVNVVTTIWPRWLIPGNAMPGPAYPGGDAIVPAGFMTKLCRRLLDEAGVSGFICYRASKDDDYELIDPGYTRRLSDRWAEVAAVAAQRTDFSAFTPI